jgi:hypothetical protein
MILFLQRRYLKGEVNRTEPFNLIFPCQWFRGRCNKQFTAVNYDRKE